VFDAHTFDLQASFFNITIVHNYEAIISENAKLNTITRMWRKISIINIFKYKALKYMKLIEQSCV
jgi:hypothetical protein